MFGKTNRAATPASPLPHFDQAAQAIRDLDLSSENDRIATLRAEQHELEDARGTAGVRLREIDNQMMGTRTFDGGSIAEALLAGKPVAAQGLSELQVERDALNAGMAVLNKRVDEKSRKIEAIKRAAAKRAGEALRPMVEALIEEARAAAETIVQAHLTVKAAGAMTGAFYPGQRALALAVDSLIGGDRLSSTNLSHATISPEVAEALATLLEKGDAIAAWQVPYAPKSRKVAPTDQNLEYSV